MSPRTPSSFYRRLLRLLPESYRREAGSEMLEVFEDAYQDVSEAGSLVVLARFWWRTLADLLATAVQVRWQMRRRPSVCWHDGIGGDVRAALRSAQARPGWSLLVVATLALGIGANTVVFSIWNAFLIRPLSVIGGDVERLVAPLALQGDDRFQVSPFDFEHWVADARSLDAIGLASPTNLNVLLDGEPFRISAAVVTPSYLDVFGTEPTLGRTFRKEEAKDVVVVSHGLWQSGFGGDRTVVGRTIRLDERAYEIVGVLPPGFDLPFGTELWVPLELETLSDAERFARDYFAVGRLGERVDRSEAEAELRTIASRLAREYPDSHAGWSIELVPLRNLMLDDFDGDLAPALRAMLAAVGLLLLIACANVFNLMLVRMQERGAELALRSALGAGQRRILRQLLVEGLVLASAGGAVGLALARFATPVVLAMSPIRPLALSTALHDASFDVRVFGFTAAICVLTGLVLGLVPAWRASRASAGRLRSDGVRTSASMEHRRWMHRLVIAETGLAVALLVCAGLVLASFERLRGQGMGFRPDGVLVARLGVSPASHPEHERRYVLSETLLERVRALPGVTSAGITTNIPLDHMSWDAVYSQEGGAPIDPRRLQLTADRLVSPGYLEALGVELISGRLLDESDGPDTERVVVVTQDLAERAWPGEDPVGKRVKRGRLEGDGPWLRVVGVVAETKEDRAAFRRARPAWYLPYAQIENERPITIVVRTTGEPVALASALRSAIADVDPNLPVYDVTTLDAHLEGFVAQERFGAVLIGSFAAFGLLLAALGVYGVLSYAATSRRHEIGVRMALGADRWNVQTSIVREGARQAAAGLILGWAVAALAGRFLGSLLFEVHPLDPRPYLVAATVCLVTAILASLVPARRATSVDPARTLRGS